MLKQFFLFFLKLNFNFQCIAINSCHIKFYTFLLKLHKYFQAVFKYCASRKVLSFSGKGFRGAWHQGAQEDTSSESPSCFICCFCLSLASPMGLSPHPPHMHTHTFTDLVLALVLSRQKGQCGWEIRKIRMHHVMFHTSVLEQLKKWLLSSSLFLNQMLFTWADSFCIVWSWLSRLT